MEKLKSMYLKNKMNKLLGKLVIRIAVEIERNKANVSNATLPAFSNKPRNLRIDLPRQILNPERMVMGDNISLGPNSFLIAQKYYPTAVMQGPGHSNIRQQFDSLIQIGNRVTATAGLQIAACNRVLIEEDVMFASNVHLNDSLHGYTDVSIPFKYQDLTKIAPICIKKGSWIGQNVVVLPGVTIGELSIVGANSVVRNNVPDRSIAAGNPARVIKRWNQTSKIWEDVR